MLYPSELQPLPQILSRATCYAGCSFLLFAQPALIAARCAADSLLPRSLLPRPDALSFGHRVNRSPDLGQLPSDLLRHGQQFRLFLP